MDPPAMRDNRPLDQWTRGIAHRRRPAARPAGRFLDKVAAKPGEMAAMTLQVFLGVRITCAECSIPTINGPSRITKACAGLLR